MRAASTLAVLLVAPIAAMASETCPQGSSSATCATATTKSETAASATSASVRLPDTKPQRPLDDLDLFGDTAAEKAKLAEPDLEGELGTRRWMLKTHQILGMATLALTAATVLIGHFNYDRLYGPGRNGSDGLLMTHRVLAYSTVGAFATTATFSVFAPKRVQREDSGFSTVDIHKLAVAGASLGMLAQVGLGFAAGRAADAGNPNTPARLAGAHQVVGWATLGLLTTAAVSLLF